MLSRILQVRGAKRMLLAGLLLAFQSQVGLAQEFQGIFAHSSSNCPGCATPQPYAQPYPSYPTPYSQPYSQPYAPMPVAPAMPVRPMPVVPGTPEVKTPDGKAPDAKADVPAQPNMNPQDFQPITSSALGDTQFAMAAPQIMGDFAGYSVRRTFFVPVTVTQTTTIVDNTSFPAKVTVNTVTNPRGALLPVTVDVPVPGRAGSGFKIADDESPIPRDRVFFSYNYFDGLRGQGGVNPGENTVTVIPAGPIVTTINQVVNPATINDPTANLHREIFGFEKTFLGGDASIEVRIPIFQATSESFTNGGFAGDNFGDVTTVLKFALVNDRDRVFSVGLATTFPTGPSIPTPQGNVSAVLFQPFVGVYRSYGDFFVQGFTSVLVSTSSQDPTLVFNDYAVGYRLYAAQEPQFLRSISPALEVHVTTPVDSDRTDPIYVPDIVSFTGGVHLGLGSNATLSVGCNIPVTGPRPYNAEGMVQLNYRF